MTTTTINAYIEAASLVLEAITRVERVRRLAPLERDFARRFGLIFIRQGFSLTSNKRAKIKTGEADDPVKQWETRLLSILDSTRKSFQRALQDAAETGVSLGGVDIVQHFAADAGINAAFDLKNPRAVEYLKDYGANALVGIEETTRERLRVLVIDAAESGKSYDKLAKEIRQLFSGMSRTRARTIATFEIGSAYEQGNLLGASQLEAAGLPMQRSWLTAKDDRVSEQCRDNEQAGWIALNEDFPSGASRALAHPNCRCTTLYRAVPE